MSSENEQPRIELDARRYFALRVIVLVLGLVFHLSYYIPSEQVLQRQLSVWVLVIAAFATVGVGVMTFRGNTPLSRMMMWALPFDLVCIALLTYIAAQTDAFYAACVLVVLLYSTVVSFRAMVVTSSAVAFAYALGHAMAPSATALATVPMALKTLSIVVIGIVVGQAVDVRRERELDVEMLAHEHELFSEGLRQRFTELQAVATITELAHSSLDFDEVGGEVIEILSRAVDIPAMCIFVLDKDKSETLFTATVGMERAPAVLDSGAIDLDEVDGHFSCLGIFDSGARMVLLCAPASDIEHLRDDDKLILSSVASEIVVAVENSQLYKLTRRLSVTDELTGISNYRFLQQRLDEELMRARRYSKYLSLLMMDVDDFKLFNDRHGHLAGDHALAELARVLGSVIREVDVAARYGGEEFAVVLPETDAAGAFVTAEKIREAIAEYMFSDAEGVGCCRLTVSIGSATYPTYAEDKESLLREADDALYRAKSGGKNRVRTPQGKPEPLTTAGE